MERGADMCYCDPAYELKACPNCVPSLVRDKVRLITENAALTVKLKSVEKYLLSEKSALRADVAMGCLSGMMASETKYSPDRAAFKAVEYADALLVELGDTA